MKKAQAFFLLMCFFILAAPVFTQEDENEPDVEADWYGELPSLYSQGDKTFNISMGLTFPTLFLQNGAVEPNHNINVVGGIGSLAYNYFLDSHFFIGFEISGQFSGTKAKNMLYIVPIGVHAGYQFIVWKIEIPLTIAIGIAPQKKLDLGYFGLFVKGGAGAYYRFNPDWSFGIDLSWSWLPQWPKEPGKNADGNFINLMVSARYHF